MPLSIRAPVCILVILSHLTISAAVTADRSSTQSRLVRKESPQGASAAEEKIASLEKRLATLESSLAPSRHVAEADNPLVADSNGVKHNRNIAERLEYLEAKVAGSTNWLPDPQLWRRVQYECKNYTDWKTDFDMRVCLDGWDRRVTARVDKPCIVYDLGIRAQPEFGMVAAQKFDCLVRAYDPSPTTQKWWDSNETDAKALKDLGESRYKLWKSAAGGTDGPLELFEYNWQQVSIFKEEDDLTRSDEMKQKHPNMQASINVPAKTLPTMMADNHDTYIDVLKVDIEGSEYMFFQNMFDRMGCPPVQQITVEYHHFSIDERYGSSPEVNTIHKLLNDCGYKCFYTRDHWRNNVESADDKFYLSPKRYTVAAYCKDCGDDADATL